MFLLLLLVVMLAEAGVHLTYLHHALDDDYDNPFDDWDAIAIIMCVFVLVALVLKLRRTIKQRDGIADSFLCDDLVCSMFPCFFFSTCQMLRHEGLTGGRYNVFSSTGSDEMDEKAMLLNTADSSV